MSGDTWTSAESVLAAAAAAAPTLDVLGDPVRLPRGYGSEAWLVRTTTTPVVLKIAVRWPNGERVANAAAAARLAATAGVTTPQALAVKEPSLIFGGRAYSAWTYLDGADAADVIPSMDDDARHAYFVKLGETMARLHSVAGPHYARTVTAQSGPRTWSNAVEDRLSQLPELYEKAGLHVDRDVHEAMRVISSLARTVSDASRPVLVHDDIYLDNLLVDPDGNPIILDFEHGRFVDAACDFVKPALFITEHASDAVISVMEGYCSDHQPVEFERRVRLALGLELVWAIPFYQDWNDDQVVDLYRSHLAGWLRQPTP